MLKGNPLKVSTFFDDFQVIKSMVIVKSIIENYLVKENNKTLII